MKRSVKEIKRIARGNLNDRYNIPIRVMILAAIIPMLLESVFTYSLENVSGTLMQDIIYYLSELLIMLLSGVLKTGESLVHLEMARGERYSIRDVFYGFENSSNHYFAGVIVRTILDVIAFAPFFVLSLLLPASIDQLTRDLAVKLLLLALAGILLTVYITLSFQLFFLVLLDEEEASVWTAVKTSFGLMRRNRIRMALLYVSFLGMYALALISLGIGLLWVCPYMKQAIAVFYMDVHGEQPEHVSGRQGYQPYNPGSY